MGGISRYAAAEAGATLFMNVGAFVKPSSIVAPPILPLTMPNLGYVTTNKTVLAAAFDYNTGDTNGETVYAHSAGSGSSDGSEGSPATLDRCLRTLLASTVVLQDEGPWDPTSIVFQDDDTSQADGPLLKYVKAATGVRPRFTCAGDDITTGTWEAVSGHADVYRRALSTDRNIYKVTRSDLYDARNFPIRLFRCDATDFATPLATSLATLDARSSGQFCDTTNRFIYAKLGAGINVESYKSILRGYYELSNGNARILCQNVPTAWDGIDFDGISMRGLTRAQSPSVVRTQMWFRNCRSFHANTIAFWVDGGFMVNENTRVHAPDSDCFLYNGDAEGESCFGMEINCHCTDAGDFEYGGTVAANANISSVHSAETICRYGGVYDGSYGPVVRDRDDDGNDTFGWNIGLITANAHSVSGLGFSVAPSGTNHRCEQWNDSCYDVNETTANLSVTQNGTGTVGIVHAHNCVYPTQIGSGTIDSYTRASPG